MQTNKPRDLGVGMTEPTSHGIFIDSQGKVRWQDISYEPFNDPEFLLKNQNGYWRY